jgi:hypothetical protein
MMKKMQVSLRESGRSFGLLALKVISGFVIGLTFALIFRQLMSLGNFMFTFVILVAIAAFIKLSKNWKFTGVLLFNLFCVMTAMLLKMYIMIAPGS